MPISITLQLAERGIGGVPGTMALLLPYAPQSYTHTITATGGFESCQIVFAVPLDVANDWLLNGLMRSGVVYGPDAETIFEGYLTQIDATFGQEQRSISLDAMGNRVRVKYTTVLGTPATTSSASDAASQALYGVRDLVLPVGDFTATSAANLRDVALATYKNPPTRPSTMVQTGDNSDVQLTLNFAGWYTAFDWLVTSNTSTTNTSTTTQVTSLTTTYNSTNAFFSTDYTLVTSSGIIDTEFIEPDTTYRGKIEKLLSQGTGTQRLAYGIYEDRKWRIAMWVGATPGTTTYRRYLGDSQVYDAYGSVVQPWNVRPDAMYEVVELLDTGPISTAQDAAARFYVERVTCSVSGDSVGVTLEPASSSALDARLARIS